MHRLFDSSDPVTDPELRKKFGIISGIVGIFVNTLIFIIEICAGFFVNSIAITADAFHNLTDAISSLITIVSFKLASKPADKEHPFGHGRIEYLSTLLIAFVIMIIGFEFMRSSVEKIMHPSPVVFRLVPFVLILLSIPAKILLSLFNSRMGARINSSTLKASAFDALSDVFVLIVASVSLITAPFLKIHIDGWLGIVVALFIMYSGFSFIKKALDPLLGMPPDPEMVRSLVGDILTYRYITGVHDLVVHNYGPGKSMASVHAEVPSEIPVLQLHESIDEAETELSRKYGIFLVIHMDPLNSNDEEVKSAKATLMQAIKTISEIRSVHDFRIVGKGGKKNLIFDVVVENGSIRSAAQEEVLRKKISERLSALNPDYNAVVNIDQNYTTL